MKQKKHALLLILFKKCQNKIMLLLKVCSYLQGMPTAEEAYNFFVGSMDSGDKEHISDTQVG